MTGRERKPAWLHGFTSRGSSAHLYARRCACGRWVIDQRIPHSVVDTYDAGVIRGADITVAIILHMSLTKIDECFGVIVLHDVHGSRGLDADGQYLAEHDCARPSLSSASYRSPIVRRVDRDYSFLPLVRAVPGLDDP